MDKLTWFSLPVVIEMHSLPLVMKDLRNGLRVYVFEGEAARLVRARGFKGYELVNEEYG